MATTPDDIRDLAPELATETDARLSRFIAHASAYVNASAWGAKADFARALFAAHLLTISKRGGVGGDVTSESVGDLSRGYGSASSSTFLSSTSYGQQFMALRRSIVMPMVVT